MKLNNSLPVTLQATTSALPRSCKPPNSGELKLNTFSLPSHFHRQEYFVGLHFYAAFFVGLCSSTYTGAIALYFT